MLNKIRHIEIRTNRIVTEAIRALGIFMCLLLLCSCATRPHSTSPVSTSDLPADVSINKDAGRGGLSGGLLFAALRLENGKDLPFVVDTGSPITILDKSLESRLGKRLTTAPIWWWGAKQKAAVHAAPKLHSGNVPLKTGAIVFVCNLKEMSSAAGHRVLGILGMDCLKHYCIQLDLAAGKMRFLDSNQLEAAKPGEAFPLVLSNLGQPYSNACLPYIHHSSLLGGQGTNLMIDTGLGIDGALEPGLLREQCLRLKGNGARRLDELIWYFPECVWDGETYTNIIIRDATNVVFASGVNVLGLRFLARHLVTLDSPGRTMYLRRQSIGPLSDDSFVLADSLMIAVADGKLPGDIEVRLNAYLNKQSLPFWFRWFGGTLDVKTYDDSTTYHYTVVRKSRHAPWKLKKAWSTDQNGQIVKEYPLP